MEQDKTAWTTAKSTLISFFPQKFYSDGIIALPTKWQIVIDNNDGLINFMSQFHNLLYVKNGTILFPPPNKSIP